MWTFSYVLRDIEIFISFEQTKEVGRVQKTSQILRLSLCGESPQDGGHLRSGTSEENWVPDGPEVWMGSTSTQNLAKFQ